VPISIRRNREWLAIDDTTRLRAARQLSILAMGPTRPTTFNPEGMLPDQRHPDPWLSPLADRLHHRTVVLRQARCLPFYGFAGTSSFKF
jgi:hypothetical protein